MHDLSYECEGLQSPRPQAFKKEQFREIMLVAEWFLRASAPEQLELLSRCLIRSAHVDRSRRDNFRRFSRDVAAYYPPR